MATAAGGGGTRLLEEAPLPGEAGRRSARRVTVNRAASPLGWLRARGLVDARQYEAGDRLRDDWTRAGLAPRTTMRWEAAAPGGARGGGGAGSGSATLVQIDAKRRTGAAMAAVGPGLDAILWRVVCDGQGMETAEGALGWPARAGRVVLGLALDRLADHYGLP